MGIYSFKISQANYTDDDKLVELLKATGQVDEWSFISINKKWQETREANKKIPQKSEKDGKEGRINRALNPSFLSFLTHILMLARASLCGQLAKTLV